MTAVESHQASVGTDLQQQYGDELLRRRAVGLTPTGRRMLVPGPLPQMPLDRPVQPAEHTAQFGLVVGGFPEAAEHRGDRPYRGKAMTADIADDDPHAVGSGHCLVQITA